MPWPHLGAFLPIRGRFYVWVLLLGSATALGVTFWAPTHAPNPLVTYFESVSAFLSYPAPGYPGRDLPLESYLSQRRFWAAGVLLESGCPTLVLLLWPWSHISLLFITVPWSSRVWGLPTTSLPPWSFLPMGIEEPHCDCLALVMFDLATPWLGDGFI